MILLVFFGGWSSLREVGNSVGGSSHLSHDETVAKMGHPVLGLGTRTFWLSGFGHSALCEVLPALGL